MPITCSTCGADQFTVGREVTIWQTLTISALDEAGRYTEDDNELHDTLDTGPFEYVRCQACDTAVPLTHLFPSEE